MILRASLSLLALAMAQPVLADCRLCTSPDSKAAADRGRPLTIDVEAALDFSRAAGTRTGGSIVVDEKTGQRQVAGLADLGGFAIKGSVRLTGEPFRQVRVNIPASVRLYAPDGSSAEAVDVRTDLPPAPSLDGNGVLVFAFGGRLVVAGSASGDFRGRIPIVADYQ